MVELDEAIAVESAARKHWSGLLEGRMPRGFIETFTDRMKAQGYEIRPKQRDAIIAHLTGKVGITKEMMIGSEPLPEHMNPETVAHQIADYLAVEGSDDYERIRTKQLAILNNARTNPAAKGKNGLGAIIFEMRESLGESLGVFAKRFEVTKGMVSHWENNVYAPQDDKFNLLCAVEDGRWKEQLVAEREVAYTQHWTQKKEEAIKTKDHGGLICAYRHLAKKSQVQLAEDVGVHPRTITQLEKGRYAKSKSMPNLLLGKLKIPDEERWQFLHIYWAKHDKPHLEKLTAVPELTDFYQLMDAYIALTHKDLSQIAHEVESDISAVVQWQGTKPKNQVPPEPDRLDRFVDYCKKLNKEMPEEYRFFTHHDEARLKMAHAPLWHDSEIRKKEGFAKGSALGTKVAQAKAIALREQRAKAKQTGMVHG